MASPTLTVPPAFTSSIQPITPLDPRPDSEILSSLSPFRPVTSERNIWAFWDTGLASMPAWCARNVAGWVRLCGPSWTIRVLDNDPSSPNYALNYLPAEAFPACFVDRTMDGAHKGQHAADMVRSASILYHGGVYIDVGSIMIRGIERICWSVLMDEGRAERVCVPVLWGTTIANHFVAARRGDPFVRAWHTLFIHLWKDRTSAAGILSHPLIAPVLAAMDPDIMRKAGMNIAMKVDPSTAFEYITQVLCWQRLCQLDYPASTPNADEPTFSPATYWRTHILPLHNIHEMHPLEHALGFSGGGQPAADLLETRLDDSDKEKVKQAEDVVWNVLARSCLQKVARGKNMTVEPTLGALWDEDEGGDADCREGTFAWVLREGAARYWQTREEVERVEPVTPAVVVRKGLLEV